MKLNRKMIDRSGRITGLLTAHAPFEIGSNGEVRWLYKCECGGEKVMFAQSAEITGHCGCLTKRRLSRGHTHHGMSGTAMYKAWFAMKDRCQNPDNHAFPSYGARGISVCNKWQTFKGFHEDMGDRPHGSTIERKDNDGNYCRENCAWETRKTQQRNRRVNRVIDGKCIAQWSEESGVSRTAIMGRLRRGWSAKIAVTTPAKIKFRKSNYGITQ